MRQSKACLIAMEIQGMERESFQLWWRFHWHEEVGLRILNRWSRKELPLYSRMTCANDIVRCGWGQWRKECNYGEKFCEANSAMVGWILTIEDLEWQAKDSAVWLLFNSQDYSNFLCLLVFFRWPYIFQCLILVLECRPRERIKTTKLHEVSIPC